MRNNKWILIFGFMVFSTFAFYRCATFMGAKADPNLRSFEKIYEMPNQTKDELYIKVNNWFVKTFVSSGSVIEFRDKEAGRIAGKYVYHYGEGMYTYNVRSTIGVDVKDGKVRVSMDDPYIEITGHSTTGSTTNAYRPLDTEAGVDRARIEWAKLAESLNAFLKTGSSNW